MTAKRSVFLLVFCLMGCLTLPAQAQKTAKDQPDREAASSEKPKSPLSVFKKADNAAAPAGDVKARHQEAKKEVRVAKRERKAAEARENAARARAEALKAEKRAVGAEGRSEKAETRAEKARKKHGNP